MIYRNDPKFSDRYALANSADPDQTAPFRVITTNVLGVRIFKKFTVFVLNVYLQSSKKEVWLLLISVDT